jgi:hypothetical protein
MGDDLGPFPIGGVDPNAPCDTAAAVDVEFDSGGTYTMAVSDKIPFQIPWALDWYQLDLSLIGLTNATWAANGSPPPDFTLTGTQTWQVGISVLSPSDCAKSNICTLRFRTVVVTVLGGHDGSLPAPGAGDVTTLNATTELAGGVRPVVVSGSCPITIQSWLVLQATTLDLTLTW